MSNRENQMNMDSTDQLTEKLLKLRAFQDSLTGKARILERKEAELRDKQEKVYAYRALLLEALRQLLLEEPSISENHALMEKYDEILDFMAVDINDDADELMG